MCSKNPIDTTLLEAAREKALKFLGYAARSETEIVRRLRKDDFPDTVIEAVLADFRARGWVDDAEFAKRWVEDRADRKLYGKSRLARELSQRGLKREDVDAALANTEDEAEIERARGALKSKTRSLISDSGHIELSPAEKQKLSGFLQRRGFAFNIITKVLKQLVENEE